MSIPAAPGSAMEPMNLLSTLLLSKRDSSRLAEVVLELRKLTQDEFNAMAVLANSNHVIVRGLEIFAEAMEEAGDPMRTGWAREAVRLERARIAKAIASLDRICHAFDEQGLDVTVMKSLDHWPDLGSDLDLYTNASPAAVCDLMQSHFGARIATQSWGDRLACKWNFYLPELPEPVEVHIQRLGQTGEQILLASRLPHRARRFAIDAYTFRVPSASDRLMISTLQRMYRHFYFRLCDVVDSAELVRSGAVDFEELRTSAVACGIWEGVATYLLIVSDYVVRYGGAPLELPAFVKETGRFGGDVVYFARGFIRVPILPQSAGLYSSQLMGLLRRRQLHSSARLGLLPWLATAAAVGQKFTGSDKGIW
jgi:hypothetical protein